MKIVVLLKFSGGEMNPFDAAALECALELGAEITVLTMSPRSVLTAVESLTRFGVRAILVSDPIYAGSDTIATSRVLAEAIKRINFDAVFAGRQSIDGDTAQVPPMLAERLGLNFVSGVTRLGQDCVTTRNGENHALCHGTLYTFEKIRALRFPSIFSRKDTVEIIDNSTLAIPREECGLFGSPTRVVRSYESNVGRRECKFIDESELDGVIREALSKKKDFSSTQKSDERIERIYYVGALRELALSVAREAVEIKSDGLCAEELAERIRWDGAQCVLFEDSQRIKEIASRTAVILGAGLCADCTSFSVCNGKLVMTRPARGGTVTADIISTSTYTFATVRTAGREERDIIVTLGMGALDKCDKIKAFAQRLGAEICATRSVVDAGGAPYEAQVGLTGRTVSPRVYIAVGVSGAVQHTSSISGSGTVIAINPDKNARIFDYSDYGIIKGIENVEL